MSIQRAEITLFLFHQQLLRKKKWLFSDLFPYTSRTICVISGHFATLLSIKNYFIWEISESIFTVIIKCNSYKRSSCLISYSTYLCYVHLSSSASPYALSKNQDFLFPFTSVPETGNCFILMVGSLLMELDNYVWEHIWVCCTFLLSFVYLWLPSFLILYLSYPSPAVCLTMEFILINFSPQIRSSSVLLHTLSLVN